MPKPAAATIAKQAFLKINCRAEFLIDTLLVLAHRGLCCLRQINIELTVGVRVKRADFDLNDLEELGEREFLLNNNHNVAGGMSTDRISAMLIPRKLSHRRDDESEPIKRSFHRRPSGWRQ